nr:efflux RND transporter periplasmic adaptor subunit [Salirhabdus salicampi]
MTIHQSFYGKFIPSNTTPIVTSRTGEVENLNVRKGDVVEEGELIATIHPGNVKIEAKTTGVIQQLDVKEGDVVSPQSALGVIVSLDPIDALFHVTADQLSLFSSNDSLSIDVSSINKSVRGDVQFVSSTANETGLFEVELSIDNHNIQLKPGMVGILQVPITQMENELIIPTRAVHYVSGDPYIYIIKENIAVRKEISILQSQSEQTAITGDLYEGAKVVTKGQFTLTDGGTVRIMKEVP